MRGIHRRRRRTLGLMLMSSSFMGSIDIDSTPVAKPMS